jgi:hypothetical protein
MQFIPVEEEEASPDATETAPGGACSSTLTVAVEIQTHIAPSDSFLAQIAFSV